MQTLLQNNIINKAGSLPLSASQLRFWILDQLEPGNAACNVSRRLKLSGKLNIDVLEKSFRTLIQQNEILRTSIHSNDGHPTQTIHKKIEFKLLKSDISSLSDDQKSKKADEISNHEASVSFVLDQPPLLRVRLIKLNETEHVLVLIIHHIIVDGWSLGLIFDEIEKHYNDYCNNRAPADNENKLQYSYYINQKFEVDLNSFDRKRKYWKNQLAGEIPIVEIPVDKKRPLSPTFNGSRVYFSIPPDLYAGLQKIKKESSASLYTLLLTAFKVLVYRYTGVERITVGSPVANRIAELNNTIGAFINMLPFSSEIHKEMKFSELLATERKITFSGFVHHDFPFEEIINEVQPKRDSQYHPIFQIMFQYIEGSELNLSGIKTKGEEIYTGKAQFDISLYCWEWDNHIDGYFEFITDIYETETIKVLSNHFINLLESISANPNQLVSEIQILSKDEINEQLVLLNDTKIDFPRDSTLIDLFEKCVTKFKTKTAVSFKDESLSYLELNSRATKLANYLTDSGVKKNTLIGIATDRSIDMVVSVLAVLKCGAAYVPLDPYFPQKRLEYMIEDSKLELVITQNEFHKNFLDVDCKIIDLDEQRNKISTFTDNSTRITTDSADLAYIIYTSGSTGKPKGVKICQRSVINFLYSMQREPGINENDILLSVTSLSFDISVLEIFLPLITGSKLVLADKATTLDASLLLKELKKTKATVMQATPSTWRLLLNSNWDKKLNLKLLCGGEPLSFSLAQQLLNKEDELWNMYGPTETTIWSSVKRISKSENIITIGKPIANTKFYILDKNKNLLPKGVFGELYISGEGIARGYHNNDELTKQKFINVDFLPAEEKLYKTGDIVRYLKNGEIEFTKRIDKQVKIRGYRIELGEIEYQLLSHSLIDDAVVDIEQIGENDVRLFGYLIPKSGTEINTQNIKKYLRKNLPDYMIPSQLFVLEKFPLTPNGKLDRKTLIKIRPDNLEKLKYEAPKNATEEKLSAIWKQVLNLKQISVTDDFFELGGHSLLAAELFFKINKLFNKNLPLSVLFTSPTIESISQLINNGKHFKSNAVVQIKKGGNRSPLFLVHGAGGNVLLYRELAQKIDTDIPVFGIQSINSTDSPEITIEKMASQYVSEIKGVQRNGPYYIGGYCMGGTIALEIARQLLDMNEKVSLLAMLETYNIYNQKKSGSLKIINKFQNLIFHIQNFFAASSTNKYAFLRKKVAVGTERQILRLKILISRSARFFNLKFSKYPHFDLEDINDNAQAKYDPVRYPGKITLFRPKKYFMGSAEFGFGWEDMCDELEVINLNVNPRGMLVQPFVDQLAGEINKMMYIQE